MQYLMQASTAFKSLISFQDVCLACGLVATSAITFVIMFMPKGRQLSAMGKEGVYAEDRTDVYTGTGSSTQSTGSGDTTTNGGILEIGGTPSPSFFPIKPQSSTITKEMLAARERMDTPPPTSPKKHRRHNHNGNLFIIDYY